MTGRRATRYAFLMIVTAVFALAESAGAQDTFVKGELVVQLVDGASIDVVNSQFNTTDVQHLPQLNIYQLDSMPTSDLEALAEEIAALEEVIFCHPNYYIDPLQPVQSSLPVSDELEIGDYFGQPAAATLELAATGSYSDGSFVKVAVLDGGIDIMHPALEGRVISGYDYVDDDLHAYDPMYGAISGHGTHIAGVIHLVAPQAEIRSYRVLDETGAGNGYIVAEAILQAVEDGCKVINLSMVTMNEHQAIHAAAAHAAANDVLVVAAAGNGYDDVPHYPASDDNVLGVAAIDTNLYLADFSSYGPHVDVLAPGTDIYGPYRLQTYAWWGGTSFAAPFVAALGALLFDADPTATATEVREAILSTAMSLDYMNPELWGQLGAGVIDPVKSLGLITNTVQVLRVPSQYPTIQSAVDAALTGDTVLVEAGTYHESIEILEKAIALKSESGPESTTVYPSRNDTTIVFTGSYNRGSILVQGFTFTGCRGESVLRINDPDLIIIDNNVFRENDPSGSADPYVITSGWLSYSITGNRFLNNGGEACIGITHHAYDALIGEIANNTFYGNSNCIYLEFLDSILVVNNIFANTSGEVLIGDDGHTYYLTRFIVGYNVLWNNEGGYSPQAQEVAGNDIYLDPLFVCEEAGDFRLLPGSPAINAGYPQSFYNDPDGSRGDIGALYYTDVDIPLSWRLRIAGEASKGSIATLTPEFTWDFYDTSASVQQSYEIQVGTDNDWSSAEMWDSGPVVASANSAAYGGYPLNDFSDYHVRIRVDGGAGTGEWIHATFHTFVSSEINVPGDVATIQRAIDLIRSGDTVMVAPGTYVENLDLGGKSVTVISSAGPEHTILAPADPQSPIVLFRAESGAEPASLSGFTVRDGSVGVNIVTGAAPLLSNNVFENNSEAGILARGADGATIRENTFHGNTVAIRADYGICVVENNTITENGPAPTEGALAFNYCDEVHCYRNIIARNNNSAGVAVYDCGPVEVWNNTVVGNTVSGVIVERGSYDLRNNLVAFNGSDGIHLASVTCDVGYNNSYGNIGEDRRGYVDLDYPGEISSDPIFEDVSASHFRLLPGSPCADAGDPNPVFDDTDGSRCDIGAVMGEPIAWPHVEFKTVTPCDENGYAVSLTPSIRWRYLDTLLTEQSEYQVQVGADQDWSNVEFWDSGPVTGHDNEAVYAGAPLTDFTRYHLRIRVRGDGDWGGWSCTTFFIKIGRVIEVPLDVSTIRGAIAVADAGDSIFIAPGTYRETVDYLGKAIVLKSTDGPETTILEPPDGRDTSVVFFVSGEDRRSILDGFTVRGGTDNILLQGSAATIVNNWIREASSWGVWSCDGHGDAVVTGNEITNNKGGVHFRDHSHGVVTVEDNVIHSNEGVSQGGGLYLKSCEETVIRGNIIAYNVAYDKGGGLCVDLGRYRIINNTIVGNRLIGTYVGGGGVFHSSVSGLDIDFLNNIIAYNSNGNGIVGVGGAEDCTFEYNCVHGNLPADYIGTEPGEGCISLPPLLADMAGLDFSLRSNSPCIDAGDPSFAMIDPNGTRNDMGALPFDQITELPAAISINLGSELTSHVLAAQPTIYWTYYDTTGSQAAFEIEIGTDFDWEVAEMWASGSIVSTDTFAVYDGLSLDEGVDYFVRLRVNNGADWGGWRNAAFHTNAAPCVPLTLNPNWGDDAGIGTNLVVAECDEIDGDTVLYDFEIYTDHDMTNMLDSITGYGSNKSGAIEGLQFSNPYWWRARTYDGFEYSQWCALDSFYTRPLAGSVSLMDAELREFACEMPVKFNIEIANDIDLLMMSVMNAFRVYSPDGAEFDTVKAEFNNGELNWDDVFWATFVNTYRGDGADTVGFSGVGLFPDTGLYPGQSAAAFTLTTELSCSDLGKTICVDMAARTRNTADHWMWAFDDPTNLVYMAAPAWDGPYCFTISPCCSGYRGNVNGDETDGNLADISKLISYVFLKGDEPPCPEEANVNGDELNKVNLADITCLIDFVYVSHEEPCPCGVFRAAPASKVNRGTEPVLTAVYIGDTTVLEMQTDMEVRGLQAVLRGQGAGSPVRTFPTALDVVWRQGDQTATFGLFDVDGGDLIAAGRHELVRIPGRFEPIDALVSDMEHREVVVAVAFKDATLPTSFELSQNYPNPFNPSTKIEFALPVATDVTLEVFNILGQRVVELAKDRMEAGVHEVIWEGTNEQNQQVASGVYFYRLTTREFTASKKMLLLK